MFKIGQKVVCVNAQRLGGYPYESYPVEGNVYTVRGFLVIPDPDDNRERIYLEEIVNGTCMYWEGLIEKAFGVERFRPIVSRKTSIEIFQRMLTPKQKELAR